MKAKLMFLSVLAVLLLPSCSTYNKMLTLGNNVKPLNVQYPAMRTVIYNDNRGYEFKNSDSNILAVIIEGSGLYSVLGWEEGGHFRKSGFWYYVVEEFKDECSILVLEKLNFETGKFYGYDVEAIKNYTLENLVSIYSFIIGSYLSENNYSKVVLLGISEGACLLPRVYRNMQNNYKVSGLISISYGGLSRYEQFKILADSKLGMYYLQREIFKSIDLFKANINLYPDSLGYFVDLPYPYMNSTLDYRPFDDYQNIDIPILFVHGELDINVPVESTKYIQDNLHGKPFEFLIYPDADHHSFMNSKETYHDFRTRSREWLKRL